jgi:hypothetical protein
MKIPEKLKESRRDQKFREAQPMVVAYKLIDLDSEDKPAIIDVRVFWRNNSMTCRAIIWINSLRGDLHGWGVGVTSGCGYHHESAAIMGAFLDVGIKLETGEGFDGLGTGAQEKAIKRLGEALGYKNTLLVYFNP